MSNPALDLPNADLFIPDGAPLAEAMRRTTHMGIGAHQDDLEIIAFHGIAECFGQGRRAFTGVTCTDGAGSPRAGSYASCTDERMKQYRLEEQRAAAAVGRYSAILQLGYPSAAVKNPADPRLTDDLAAILRAARPEVLYTHCPADRHDTHVSVACAVLRAVRRLPAADRPARVYGCEVWRTLDWLCGEDKVVLDVSGRSHLAAALLGVFDSQIAGGKRYDLATLGRWRANATYGESHNVDTATETLFAMDLGPLVRGEEEDPLEFVARRIRRFEQDVAARLAKALGVKT
jgi:LmbE family N-acetylglucosaminyl deacetylase